MKENLVLKAEIRKQAGSKSAAKIRKAGRVPAVIYGHKQEPLAVSLDEHNLVEGLRAGGRVVELQMANRKETVIVKDLQYDCLGKKIIHVDLVRVDVTETVTVEVSIELKGASTAPGTIEGGIIEKRVSKLEIECKVNDIPEVIVVSVKEMAVGDFIHAGDIELPAELKLKSDPEILVATCSLVTAAKTTEEIEEEMPTSPEVIGEKKEEAEGVDEDKSK